MTAAIALRSDALSAGAHRSTIRTTRSSSLSFHASCSIVSSKTNARPTCHSAVVAPQFRWTKAKLKDGDEVNGLLTGETGAELDFLLPSGIHQTVARSDVASTEIQERSPMPDGLIQTRQGVGAFVLRAKPKPRPVDVLAELRAARAALNTAIAALEKAATATG